MPPTKHTHQTRDRASQTGKSSSTYQFGNVIYWYDPHERMWTIYEIDAKGNQVSESSEYTPSKAKAMKAAERMQKDIDEGKSKKWQEVVNVIDNMLEAAEQKGEGRKRVSDYTRVARTIILGIGSECPEYEKLSEEVRRQMKERGWIL